MAVLGTQQAAPEQRQRGWPEGTGVWPRLIAVLEQAERGRPEGGRRQLRP
jgi:hypothetical protein